MLRYSLMFLALCLAVGCGEDTGPSGPADRGIEGSWREAAEVREDRYVPDLHTLHIATDRFTYLYETDEGFRGVAIYERLLTPTEIEFDGDAWRYERDGDTMTLTYDGRTIVLIRDPNGATPENFYRRVPAISRSPLPVERPGDLAWDGDSFSLGQKSGDAILGIDPQTLAVSEDVPFDGLSRGIVWHNDELWSTHGGHEKIYKVNPQSGAVVLSSIDIAPWNHALASDGGRIWVASNTRRAIYEYDPNLNLVGRSKTYASFSPNGMTYANGSLYVTHLGVIHRLSVATFRVVEKFGLDEGYLAGGLGFDGQHLWVVGSKDEGDSYELFRIAVEN